MSRESSLTKNGKVKPAGKEVGPLSLDEFRALVAWCRNVGLLNDAKVIEDVIGEQTL